MEESILTVFAASIIPFYSVTTKSPAVMGMPFLGTEDEKFGLDFSAVIGISGNYRGKIFYTAPRSKLQALLPMLGERAPDDNLCGELVGEITNTISGNVRQQLGGGFIISPPFLFTGRPDLTRPVSGVPSYILPIEWNSHSSRVMISLVETDTIKNP